jgi:hypothetical protein
MRSAGSCGWNRLPAQILVETASVCVHRIFQETGCATFPKPGATGQVPYAATGMEVHFLNVALLGKPLDPLQPRILVYEPVGDKPQLDPPRRWQAAKRAVMVSG